MTGVGPSAKTEISSKIGEALKKMENAGILTVRVIEAQLCRNMRTFGEMQPQVVVKAKGSTQSTKPQRGMRPVWNEIFEIPIYSLSMTD